MNESRTPRTWNEGWRCAECCTGDRCDDPSHYDRPKCPHCHGTGSAIWNMYSKEDEAKKLKSALTAALARAEKAEAELERVRKDRSVTLTGRELLDAVEFIDDDPESEVCIQWFDACVSDDVEREPMPAGYYIFLTDYPEEGRVQLGPIDAAIEQEKKHA